MDPLMTPSRPPHDPLETPSVLDFCAPHVLYNTGVASEATIKFIEVQSHCKLVQTLMVLFQMKGQPPRL
eukprot:6645806-Pyramimonas_sp.AAC.1